ERLRDTTAGARPIRRASNIAVVPAHEGAPVAQFCEKFETVLNGIGKTARLNSAVVDATLGREGIAQTYERGGNNIRLLEWLSGRELAGDYVLYEADPFLSPWSERCVRQADIVLLVGSAKADPAPGEVESELLASREAGDGRREWLVLVHEDAAPSGTARWLDARSVERHFHVRLDDRGSLDRLARFLTGRAVGLTLGGGFARGLAHLGAFQAFGDLGVGIDAIGGASMGAMVGALWAMGWTAEQITREISSGCARKFDDLTFPFVAFKTGRNFSSLVRRLFGDLQIEDLWLPYFCISANLNRCELRSHLRGSLAKAMLAATRAPGLFPPVIYEGELHVDGGVINNVPVDLMRPFTNDGVTVGIDVSPPHELHPVRDYGDEISGFPALWKRLNPFSKSRLFTPSILLVMIRTLEYSGMSYKETRLKYADIYMCPDMLPFKRTDFHRAGDILATGYECARRSILEWLRKPEGIAKRPDLRNLQADSEAASPTAANAARAGATGVSPVSRMEWGTSGSGS
ncbi:MAG: patatin-like phospholipase family protein, partial [Acidobacteriota bacterium]|nr:patatin-like phospholipase family protein [Acidobacteriota bacterium]